MGVETDQNTLPGTSETDPFVIAEYEALRAEILKRVELRFQAVSLTLVVFGTIVGVALQTHVASLALLYPTLATFLTANWAYQGFAIKEVGDYIKTSIEAKVGEETIGWEHQIGSLHRPQRGLKSNPGRGIFHMTYSGGIFLGTSLLAILIALSLAKFSLTEILLFIADAISLLYAVVILVLFYRQHMR